MSMTKFIQQFFILIGHAKRSGATKDELDVLTKAVDIIRKYGKP